MDHMAFCNWHVVKASNCTSLTSYSNGLMTLFSLRLLPNLECFRRPYILLSVLIQLENNRLEISFLNHNLKWLCLLLIFSLEDIAFLCQYSI
jgi:hypothetical protein